MSDSLQNEVTTKNIIIFTALCIGCFMAVLDIQIVSSSLMVIAAGLSASSSEMSWVQTSYLIAEIMMIPATGFLSRAFSTRIFYFVAAVGFTVMSILCGLAWNINSMIIFRAVQGFFGGALIPTAFSVTYIIFPKHMQTKVTTIVGLVVTVAPIIGPTIGGYITEHLSWHVMFFMNVAPGVIVSIIALIYMDFDRPHPSLLKHFDFAGLFLMMFGLGTMQYVLEEGSKHNWFEDTKILVLTILFTTALLLLIIREMTFSNPIINFQTYKNSQFSIGCLYSFILGIGLYGTVYLLPLFLFTIADFNAAQIGFTVAVAGLFQLISAPLAAKLTMAGLDKRIVLAIGIILFGVGSYYNGFMNADSRNAELFIPQMLRGLAIMFCFIPINDIALASLPQEDIPNASGLYNLNRNLGGAIGLAVINTIINNKTTAFMQNMNDTISTNSTMTVESLNTVKAMLDGKVANPELATYYLLENTLYKEAFILAINNIFIIICYIFFTSLLLLPFVKKTNNQDGETKIHGH